MTHSPTRIAVALSTTLVLGACHDNSDPLAPTAAPTASITASVASTGAPRSAAVVGADLIDATDVFLGAVEDAQLRTDLRGAITALGERLIAGDATGSASALATARERLVAVGGDAALTEMAPVALALDGVEQALAAER